RRDSPKGPMPATTKRSPHSGKTGPPPTAVRADPRPAGGRVSGTRARPRHKAAANPTMAPWTLRATPAICVSAIGTGSSSLIYHRGLFHRMTSATKPKASPRQNSKFRLIAPSCPMDDRGVHAVEHRVQLPPPSTTTNTNQSAEGGGQLQLFVRRLYR